MNDSIELIRKLWGLSNLEPLRGASGARIFAATLDQRPVVLRVAPAGESASHQTNYLAAFGGHGTVRLLRRSDDSRAILMERALPGLPLEERREPEAIAAWIEVAERLHSVTPPGAWPTLEEWFEDLGQGAARLPSDLLAQGVAKFEHLLATTTTHVLLHADLHYGNILRSGNGWVAIDPLCAIGDPVAEAARMLIGSWPGVLALENPDEIVMARVQALSQTMKWNPERILDWAFVLACCVASWTARASATDWHFAAVSAYFLRDLRARF